MRVVNLIAENFKILQAVEITPEGDIVTIGGDNGSGKTSVLDAIYVALVGRSVNPPQPIRKGAEKCHIKLDLGELVVVRTFTAKDGGTYTDTLKVETAEGLRYGQPQQVLDALLGEIGFDPFEFVQMKPKEQAETLLRMVPLPVDLDEMGELDQSDYLKRRDVNRDAAGLKAQLAAIPKEEVPKDAPDRNALIAQLGNAASANADIERDIMARERTASNVDMTLNQADMARQSAARLRKEADEQDALAAQREQEAKDIKAELDALPPLAQMIDTAAIREQIRSADEMLARIERQKRRTELEGQHSAKVAEAEKLTEALAGREKERQAALAGAKMPIDGLAFAVDEKGQPTVQFAGVPFEQASTAEQLRASTAIAMAANPSLRVLRVKDGSLLDDKSMKLLAEMATAEDFQLWIERVGTGGVGIVMENGTVRVEPTKKELSKSPDETDALAHGLAGANLQGSKKAKPADKPEGTLV